MFSVSIRSIPQLILFSLAIGFLFGPAIGTANAQGFETPNFGGKLGGKKAADPFKLTAKFQSYEGTNKGLITVTAKVDAPWHIYSLTQPEGGPTRSEIIIEESDKFTIGEFEPDTDPHSKVEESFAPVKSEYHEGTVNWSAPVEFAEGTDPEKLSIDVSYVGLRCAGIQGCVPIRGLEVVANFAGQIETIDSSDPLRIKGSHLLISGKLTHITGGKLKPGEDAFVEITLEPVDGFHVYEYSALPNDETIEKLTLLAVTKTRSVDSWTFKPVETIKPSADKVKKKKNVENYEAAVTFKIPFTVPKEAQAREYRLTGVAGFQTCNATGCNRPTGLKWAVSVPVGVDSDASTNLQVSEIGLDYGDVEATFK